MRRCIPGLLVALACTGAQAAEGTAVPERPYDARIDWAIDAAARPGDTLSDAVLLHWLRPETKRRGLPEARVVSAVRHLDPPATAGARQDWRTAAVLVQNHWQPRAERDALEARMLALAPDNGFVHLLAMTRAHLDGRPADVLAHAAAGAASTRYDDLLGPAAFALWERLGRPQTTGAVALAMTAAASTQPSYESFGSPCRAADGALRDACLQLAMLMIRDAESAIDVSIAADLVDALGDDAQRAEAQARELGDRWRHHAALPHAARFEQDAAFAVGYLQRLGREGERAAQAWALEQLRMPAAPPDDWVPPE